MRPHRHGRGAQNIRARDICTRKAFENAIAGVAATGGSTNAVLHLLAMAREAEVPLSIDDFDGICARTPFFVDIKPGGRFMAADVDKAGGIPVIAKRLVEGGFVDGSAVTVTGRTFAEEAADAKETPGQEVVLPLDKVLKTARWPRHPERKPGARRLRDQTGRPRSRKCTRGPARVFDREEDAMAAVIRRQDQCRRCGGDSLRRSARRTGHARNAGRHGRHCRRGSLRQRGSAHRRPLQRRDARLHDRPRGSPEAFNGGPIAFVHEGDSITVDADRGVLNLDISAEEMAKRKAAWTAPELKYKTGVFAKYCALVSSASEGAITQPK